MAKVQVPKSLLPSSQMILRVTLNENTYLLVSPKLYLTKLWKVCQREASPCKLDDSPSERGAPPEFLCLLFKYPLTLSIGVNFHQ